MAASKSKKQADAEPADNAPVTGENPESSGDEPSAEESKQRVKPSGVSGPGTGSEAPEDEQDRMPSTTVVPSEAGPLVPTDVQRVNDPAEGHPESSTNPVSASATQLSVPGSNHMRLVDEDGNDLNVDDVFTEQDGPSMFVYTRKRVYQEFTYPKASTKTTQLLYPANAKVTLAEALRFKSSMKTQQSQG